MALPFYRIVVNEEDETGVDFNAFVDAPAHMKSFIAFGKDSTKYSFTEDSEKRIVTGVMISAGTPIYRNDPDFGEHYVVFNAETIETIKRKFFKKGFNMNLNEDHDPNKVIQGAYLQDSYTIHSTDPNYPNVPEAFKSMNLQDGTWIASYHVTDDAIWDKVKSGKFTGFSVEGWFDKTKININQKHMKLERFDKVSQVSKYHVNVDAFEVKLGEQLNYIDVNGDKVPVVSGEYLTENNEKILVDADGKIQNIGFAKTNKMTDKKEKLWDTVKSLFVGEEAAPEVETESQTFAEATTAEGVVVMYEGELAEGTPLFIAAAEGEEQMPVAPDETYQLTLEDGSIKIVAVDANSAVVSVEDLSEEPEDGMSEAVETELREEIKEVVEQMSKTFNARFDSVEKENKALKAELETIKKGEKFNNKGKAATTEETQKPNVSQLLKNK